MSPGKRWVWERRNPIFFAFVNASLEDKQINTVTSPKEAFLLLPIVFVGNCACYLDSNTLSHALSSLIDNSKRKVILVKSRTKARTT
jgi:hypothetical protein